MALTKEQALAKARARLRLQKAPPNNLEVARQAAIRGPAGIADSMVNGVALAPQMAYGAAATALGRPDLAPNIEKPYSPVMDYFTNNNNLPNYVQLDPEALANQTPGQEILGAAVEGATGGALGRGKTLANMALGAGAMGAGEAVTQATDNPLLGLAASVAAPMAATRAIPSLNIEKRIAQMHNAERDAVLQRAREAGLAYVPEGRISDFADRPKLLQAVNDANRITVNNIARKALGLPKDSQLNEKTVEALRLQAYNSGYVPLKSLGRNPLFVDPATGTTPYLDDLIAIETAYSGSKGTFPDAVPAALRDITQKFTVPDMDAADVVDKVRQLRKEASKALNSATTTPEGEQLAFAKKAIADALENELERHATASGNPQLVDAYRKARKQIAVSHLVEDAVDPSSWSVSPEKLGKLAAKGIYMDGDLKKAGDFYAMNYGRRGEKLGEATPHYFKAVAGYELARSAALTMGLPPGAIPALALAGATAAQIGSNKVQKGLRNYLTSGLGQARNLPDYTHLGTEPMLPALSGAGFFDQYTNEE